MTTSRRVNAISAHRLIEDLCSRQPRSGCYLLRRPRNLHRRFTKNPTHEKVLIEEMAKAFGYTLGVEDLQSSRNRRRHGRVLRLQEPKAPILTARARSVE